jgi:cytochrome c-type biogenesis protein CcmH/NrfF
METIGNGFIFGFLLMGMIWIVPTVLVLAGMIMLNHYIRKMAKLLGNPYQ